MRAQSRYDVIFFMGSVQGMLAHAFYGSALWWPISTVIGIATYIGFALLAQWIATAKWTSTR